MNPNDIPQAGWAFQFAMTAVQWLELVVYLVGLGVAIWGFRRSRKCGYLVFAACFAVTALWLVAAVPVWKAMHANDPPDVSEQTRQRMDAAEREAANKVLTEAGHPPLSFNKSVKIPVGPIALVVGVWLLARREMPIVKP
jgi:hypothetical protein